MWPGYVVKPHGLSTGPAPRYLNESILGWRFIFLCFGPEIVMPVRVRQTPKVDDCFKTLELFFQGYTMYSYCSDIPETWLFVYIELIL